MSTSLPPPAERGQIRVLMELRTCFERFAGIPQETRLLFSAFLDDAGLQTSGLLNHTSRRLSRGLIPGKVYDADSVGERYDRLARLAISTQAPGPRGRLGRTRSTMDRELAPWALALRAKLGAELKMFEFDARDYAEFVWDNLFAVTLPPAELAKVSAARYRTLSATWTSLQRSGLIGGKNWGRYPTLDSRGYDIFLSQTPYPARMAPGCRLVVRYHDAIPMFLPHTIHTARFHQKSHYRALRDNARHAVFACTSAAARSDVLKMFPTLEHRTPVIHDIVSDSYFPEAAAPGAIAEIVRSRSNPHTEPKWISTREKTRFYERIALDTPPRYLLMVSTVEPRKNHLRLIRAWERLRARVDPDLQLIVVGALGWGVDPIVDAMRPWQERGALFNLCSVPTGDLRVLYGAAECVVCPSVAEGFDLSGVEAMLSGAAVAASDIPVHREVYGECAEYFDRYDVTEMAAAIGRLLGPAGAGRRAQLRERGLQHAQRYKPDATTPNWTDLFERIRGGAYPLPS